MSETIKRTLKFSLDFANAYKKEAVERLWGQYQTSVNYFLRVLHGLWQQNKKIRNLPEEIVKQHYSLLSYRYKQCAKRQAEGIFHAWLKRKRRTNTDKCPQLENVSMVLDNRFFKIERSNNSFDFWMKLALLEKGKPRWFPFKNYNYAKNNYFDNLWKLANAIRVVKKKEKWFVELTFEKEIKQEPLKEIRAIGADIGYRKLIATSDGQVFGENVKALAKKATNKKQGSKSEKRLRQTIKNQTGYAVRRFVNHVKNNDFNVIAIELLKNLKSGKSGKWAKKVNRMFSFWIYSYAIKRIRELARVVGVQCVQVPAQYTSQTCPQCLHQHQSNRCEEKFKCQKCNYEDDADIVGAINVQRLGSEHIVRYAGKDESG